MARNAGKILVFCFLLLSASFLGFVIYEKYIRHYSVFELVVKFESRDALHDSCMQGYEIRYGHRPDACYYSAKTNLGISKDWFNTELSCKCLP